MRSQLLLLNWFHHFHCRRRAAGDALRAADRAAAALLVPRLLDCCCRLRRRCAAGDARHAALLARRADAQLAAPTPMAPPTPRWVLRAASLLRFLHMKRIAHCALPPSKIHMGMTDDEREKHALRNQSMAHRLLLPLPQQRTR